MASAAASSHSTASILRFTYQLGRSLYIPLTSRCNSIPLPITRGPGFVLNSDVVDVLRNVRQVEHYGGTTTSWMNNATTANDEDPTIYKVGLPEYDLPLVNTLYNYNNENKESTSSSSSTSSRNNNDSGNQHNNVKNTQRVHIQEDSIQPSIAMLVDQVASHLEDDLNLHEVCIAGEGEVSVVFVCTYHTLRACGLLNRVDKFRTFDIVVSIKFLFK